MPAKDPTAAERRRRSDVLRKQGGLVAPVRLTSDHLEMLVAAGWLDIREADAVRDNERLRTRLYAEACGVAVGHLLDTLAKSRVSRGPHQPD